MYSYVQIFPVNFFGGGGSHGKWGGGYDEPRFARTELVVHVHSCRDKWASPSGNRLAGRVLEIFFFFFVTLKARVERCTKSMSLKFEPASEPLHVSAKKSFLGSMPAATYGSPATCGVRFRASQRSTYLLKLKVNSS